MIINIVKNNIQDKIIIWTVLKLLTNDPKDLKY